MLWFLSLLLIGGGAYGACYGYLSAAVAPVAREMAPWVVGMLGGQVDSQALERAYKRRLSQSHTILLGGASTALLGGFTLLFTVFTALSRGKKRISAHS